MSLQLILSHYLSGLRERNELDVLLPELLKSMGHTIVSRPQTGVAQAGVDVVSTAVNAAGQEELFLFIIKFGDIGRQDLFTGPQAIQPSVREASTTFVRSRLSEAQRALPKRIVVVSNGILRQDAGEHFPAIVDEVAAQGSATLEFWGMDHLTPLIEKYVFDESLLLGQGTANLRAALAGLEESETAIGRFIRFVDDCLTVPEAEAQDSRGTRQRKFLRRCAAAAMGHAVILVWGQSENNLKPAVVAGEYLVLRLWAEAVKLGFTGEAAFHERLNASVNVHVQALQEYYAKVMPSLLQLRVVLNYRPNRVFYAQLIFEELGRLATLQLLMRYGDQPQEQRRMVHDWIIAVIDTHSISHRPLLDGQSIDLALVFAALAGEGDTDSAIAFLNNAIHALLGSIRRNRFLPVDTDLLEDAIAIHDTEESVPRAFFEVSTLIPMLASAAAFLAHENSLTLLREMQTEVAGVTLERWFPNRELESFTGAKRGLAEVGVSRVLSSIRENAQLEAQDSLSIPNGASAANEFAWQGSSREVLAALSARHHRHPVPTWFLADAIVRQPTTAVENAVSP